MIEDQPWFSTLCQWCYYTRVVWYLECWRIWSQTRNSGVAIEHGHNYSRSLETSSL